MPKIENDEIYLTGKKQGKEEEKQEQKEETIRKMCAKPKYTDADVPEIEDIPLSEVAALRKKLRF